jgi:hypothetical protein
VTYSRQFSREAKSHRNIFSEVNPPSFRFPFSSVAQSNHAVEVEKKSSRMALKSDDEGDISDQDEFDGDTSGVFICKDVSDILLGSRPPPANQLSRKSKTRTKPE